MISLSDLLNQTHPLDITPLRESEQMIRHLLGLFHGPALIVDETGIIEHCNNYMLWLAGEESSLAGKEFVSICSPPESCSEIVKIFKLLTYHPSITSTVLCKVTLRNDRSEYLVNWKICPIDGPINSPKKVVLIGYNIGDYRPMHTFDPIVSPFDSPGVFIVQDGRFKFWNSHVSFFSGMNEEEMIDCDYLKIVHPEDIDIVKTSAKEMLKGKRTELYEYRFINKYGEIGWATEAVVSVIYGGRRAALGYVVDTTQKKNMEKTLTESENIYRTIFENSGTAMIMFDNDLTISMANKEAQQLCGYSWSEIKENNIKWTQFVAADDLDKMLHFHTSRMNHPTAPPHCYEFSMITRYGARKNIFFTTSIIPGTTKRLGSLIDITARRQAEDKLKFLVTHDKLTGLSNRRSFEEQLDIIKEASLTDFTLVVCDIDGLKLINDAFGHGAGDAALTNVGRILAKCSRPEYVVARTGGDEFAILMRGTGYDEAEELCSLIRQSMEDYNNTSFQFPISVSLGFAVAETANNNPYDLLKTADNNMYREKLLHGQSIRSNIVQIAMKALGERDFVTEGHAERLRTIVSSMLIAYGQGKPNSSDMILLAEFHDIGKVGIPDHILFKPGPLTDDEYKEMQRHCEIGQRIALSSPDLAPIANFILNHHERWDGNGYPLRLKGEEIPLACRILAIADSYDAMTSDRPYRTAMSHQDALEEINRCSGSQFDPNVVDVFMRQFSSCPVIEGM